MKIILKTLSTTQFNLALKIYKKDKNLVKFLEDITQYLLLEN